MTELTQAEFDEKMAVLWQEYQDYEAEHYRFVDALVGKKYQETLAQVTALRASITTPPKAPKPRKPKDPYACKHSSARDHTTHHFCPTCGYAIYRRSYPNGWSDKVVSEVWVVGEEHSGAFYCQAEQGGL